MPLQKGIIPLSELPLRNDFMFAEVMRTSDICQLFWKNCWESVFNASSLSTSRKIYLTATPTTASVWAYLKDESGTVFNVEMQSVKDDDLAKRARFYQGAIDRSELSKSTDYSELSDSYIIFVCDFDYFHIGKAVGKRISFLEDTETIYDDGSHVFFLNSHYTEGNASQSILEFLDMIRTNDIEKSYETPLGQKAKARVQAVRSDKELEVSYMTIAQKMRDERRMGFKEGRAEGRAEGRVEGHAEGRAEGRTEMANESIAALKGLLEPSIIAEKFKVPLKQVLEIWGQE